MITPSQASAIAELFRQAADVLELNTHEGCPCADCSPRANARADIRHDLRDWARDLDGLVRDRCDGVALAAELHLLSLCPHCSDPLCDDRCKETR